ncbi:hypothetical protein RIF29_37871 [Crotalaria pallida]|uniref:Uncharacterized protein n=1 Tax=Crotalaria pallida TaxID=3830 RepID=A0AAN9E0L8_CROPI
MTPEALWEVPFSFVSLPKIEHQNHSHAQTLRSDLIIPLFPPPPPPSSSFFFISHCYFLQPLHSKSGFITSASHTPLKISIPTLLILKSVCHIL